MSALVRHFPNFILVRLPATSIDRSQDEVFVDSLKVYISDLDEYVRHLFPQSEPFYALVFVHLQKLYSHFCLQLSAPYMVFRAFLQISIEIQAFRRFLIGFLEL